MKEKITVVCHHEYGVPERVARVEKWELPSPKPNEVLVMQKVAPVNPADLNMLEGQYAVRPPLPAVPGMKGLA